MRCRINPHNEKFILIGAMRSLRKSQAGHREGVRQESFAPLLPNLNSKNRRLFDRKFQGYVQFCF